MKSVYLETTIISYLAALPSRDLIKAARQQIAWEWWNQRRQEFDLYVSELVVEEASGGDAQAASRRMDIIEEIPILDVSAEAERLAADLMGECLLPAGAVDDALHLAVAASHGMDYLLTWNCKHLANAELIHIFETRLLDRGLQAPFICTPDELLEKIDV